MKWVIKMFSSTIGQKVIMALTGLFLCTFLIVHMVGNLQLFKSDDGLAFNSYSVFMTTNPVIKCISYLLYTSILLHALQSFILTRKNRKARPVQYAVQPGAASSHWTSRNMGILGSILLLFIVIHMYTFWFQYKFGTVPYTAYYYELSSGERLSRPMSDDYHQASKMEESIESSEYGQFRKVIVKDLYKKAEIAFKNLWMVIFYVVCMFAVSFHLFHGFKSAFQSVGLNHSRYNGIFSFLGFWLFAIIIPAGFAAMPLYFYFK